LQNKSEGKRSATPCCITLTGHQPFTVGIAGHEVSSDPMALHVWGVVRFRYEETVLYRWVPEVELVLGTVYVGCLSGG
jgi:hypothetical protein